MEGINLNSEKKQKDDLDFNCEICGDRPGGCPQCGLGREAKEDLKKEATEEELKQFFEDIDEITKRKED